jgi:hypothetical protein
MLAPAISLQCEAMTLFSPLVSLAIAVTATTPFISR